MDRMSPLDASFLAIEDENTPMHIGNVSIFEGPPPTYGDVVGWLLTNEVDEQGTVGHRLF